MKYEIISGVMLRGILQKKGGTIDLDPESADALDLVGRNLIEPFREKSEDIPKIKDVEEESFEDKDKKPEKEVESPKKRGRPKKEKK